EDIPFKEYEGELKKNRVLNEILDLFPKNRKEKLSLIKYTGKVLLTILSLYAGSELIAINVNKTEIINEIYYEEQKKLDLPIDEEIKDIDLEHDEEQNNLVAIDFKNRRRM